MEQAKEQTPQPIETLTPFAYVKAYIDGGRMLVICEKEYQAWYYDTYIFDAIDLAKKWMPHQITYDRITHLRYWLRENSSHGHDQPFNHLRSLRAVKLFIDELIIREYPNNDDWREQREFSLRHNAEIFSASANHLKP